jgi:hypothetical protein
MYQAFGRKNKGIVLITVLILLQLLTLAGWYGLAMSAEAAHNAHQLAENEEVLNAAETVLLKAEKNLMAEDTTLQCFIATIALADLKKKSENFWHSDAVCQGMQAGMPWQFVVEFLAHDPCLSLQKNKNSEKNTGADYYRLTVRMNEVKYLQAVLRKTAVTSEKCKGQDFRFGTAGQQSWYEA